MTIYPINSITGASFMLWKLSTSPVAINTYPKIITKIPIPKSK